MIIRFKTLEKKTSSRKPLLFSRVALTCERACPGYETAFSIYDDIQDGGMHNHLSETVNSMSFIWNDNMREKREANANAT